MHLNIDKKYLNYISIFYTDLQTEEVFQYKGDESVSSASVIKLFIMAKFLEMVEAESFYLHQTIKMKDYEKVIFSGEFINKETYSFYELLKLMIVNSCNDATNIFIKIIGIDEINGYLIENGYRNTLLRRYMLDFEMRKGGKDNLTSAKDISCLLEKIYKLELPYSREMLDILKIKKDKLIFLFENSELQLASKHGDLEEDEELDEVKNDAAIVFTKNGDYIISIFTWGLDKVTQTELIYRLSKDVYEKFKKCKML